MSEQEITEAAAAVQVTIGVSAYLHGIDYSLEKFLKELHVTVDHIKSRTKAGPRVLVSKKAKR